LGGFVWASAELMNPVGLTVLAASDRVAAAMSKKKAPATMSPEELRAAMRPTPTALRAARILGAQGGATAAKNMTTSARRERALRGFAIINERARA
jgi:hypothetical protein